MHFSQFLPTHSSSFSSVALEKASLRQHVVSSLALELRHGRQFFPGGHLRPGRPPRPGTQELRPVPGKAHGLDPLLRPGNESPSPQLCGVNFVYAADISSGPVSLRTVHCSQT